MNWTKGLRSFGLSNTLILSSLCSSIAYICYESKRLNTKVPVIDASILKDNPHSETTLAAMDFQSASTKPSAGHCVGHKMSRKDPRTGEVHYFYYKETFTRHELINELIVGALAKEIFGAAFPKVYLHETPINNLEDQARFGFLSESLGGQTHHSNLEDWAKEYMTNYQLREFSPKHLLGSSIAFDMLVGKSDCKLANLVILWNSSGACYSIDHESAYRFPPQFMTSPSEALAYISEFAPKSLSQYTHEGNCLHLDTNDNIDQPLKARLDVKSTIESHLLTAIETDVADGTIAHFYKSFAALSNERLKEIIAQFKLLTADESKQQFEELQTRRNALISFMNKMKNTAAKEEKPSPRHRRQKAILLISIVLLFYPSFRYTLKPKSVHYT